MFAFGIVIGACLAGAIAYNFGYGNGLKNGFKMYEEIFMNEEDDDKVLFCYEQDEKEWQKLGEEDE